MEALAEKDPNIRTTVVHVLEMSRDEEERYIADAREKARRDKEAEIGYAIAEGKAEGKVAAARKMKADGMEVALISKYTELSIAEIEKL